MKPMAIRSKYGNKKTTIDGFTFHSLKEGNRYKELKLLENARKIRNLQLQTKWELNIKGIKICTYICDFQYEEKQEARWNHALLTDTWHRIIEDVKGVKTNIYRIKKKLMKAIHDIEIRET